MTKSIHSATRLALAALLAVTLIGCSSSDDDGDNTGNNGNNGDNGDNGNTGTEDGISRNTVDRMGRPGVSTALVATGDDKDAYNASGNPAEWSMLFTAAIVERADIIDTFDDITGNALLGSSESLASILVDDRLQIDTLNANCNQYLAIEIGLEGCGGRTLRRDVIDDTLQHLVSQNNPVMDLAGDDSPVTDAWPFLALPNTTP